MAHIAKWTILTYIAAHNDLDQLGRKSLLEIINVGSTADVVYGALYDVHAGAGRYVMGETGTVRKQERLGSFDCGDPDGLIATATWLFRQYPAKRYGVVLWSHGSGWEPAEIEDVAKEARPATWADAVELKERSGAPGSRALFRTTLRSLLKPEKRAERAILFDDGTGHSLDTLELSRVAHSIAKAVGKPLELLGMDACLMANLEVAYELRNAVHYLVASEELVPGHSWPYKEIFGALRANPDLGGGEFAKMVVEEYVGFYKDNQPPGGDVTKVAIDLNRIAEVCCGLDELAAALLSKIDSQALVLWQAQDMTRQHEEGPRKSSHATTGKRTTKFDFHLWDIGTLTRELSTAGEPGVKAAAQSLREVLSPGASAVLSEGHVGSWFDGIAGATVYLVRAPTRVSPYYAKLAFANDTRWGELVSAYRQFFA